MTERSVSAGQVWRHFKGDLYMVLAVADYVGAWDMPTGRDAEGFPAGTHLVVYVGLYDNPRGNRPCARSVSEWLDMVKWKPPHLLGTEVMQPRFALVT